MLTVGEKFPQYRVQACVGTGKDDLTTIESDRFEGRWVVYFFYPKDFTFVCPTEIVEFNKRLRDFQDRDCDVVGGSTDNEFSHRAWRQAHPDLKDLNYPLIAAQKLAADLGILRTAARYNQGHIGVYARVLQGGNVRRGDAVWLQDARA